MSSSVSGDTVVIDSSVIVSVFKDELDALALVDRALAYERRVMSATTWLETAMVCEGREDLGGGAYFDRIIAALGVELAPFTARQAEIAREAFKACGKGRKARARLNFGDCFVYALAKDMNAPLLFKGADFVHTDIEPA